MLYYNCKLVETLEEIMAKVYMVRGSEDGNIGVYSSRKKATERAVQYVQRSFEGSVKVSVERSEWMTHVYPVDADGETSYRVSAEVEAWDVTV
jgi:hypothetical protein